MNRVCEWRGGIKWGNQATKAVYPSKTGNWILLIIRGFPVEIRSIRSW